MSDPFRHQVPSTCPITSEGLEDLRGVLERASPGQWERLAGDWGRRIGNESVRVLTGHSPTMFTVETHDPQHHHDAAYVATFCPPMVRQLLDAVERLIEVETWMTTFIGPREWPPRDQEIAELDRAVGEEIDNRDRLMEKLDELAYAIAPQRVIGEHSSHNDPWANALRIVLDNGPLA